MVCGQAIMAAADTAMVLVLSNLDGMLGTAQSNTGARNLSTFFVANPAHSHTSARFGHIFWHTSMGVRRALGSHFWWQICRAVFLKPVTGFTLVGAILDLKAHFAAFPSIVRPHLVRLWASFVAFSSSFCQLAFSSSFCQLTFRRKLSDAVEAKIVKASKTQVYCTVDFIRYLL